MFARLEHLFPLEPSVAAAIMQPFRPPSGATAERAFPDIDTAWKALSTLSDIDDDAVFYGTCIKERALVARHFLKAVAALTEGPPGGGGANAVAAARQMKANRKLLCIFATKIVCLASPRASTLPDPEQVSAFLESFFPRFCHTNTLRGTASLQPDRRPHHDHVPLFTVPIAAWPAARHRPRVAR